MDIKQFAQDELAAAAQHLMSFKISDLQKEVNDLKDYVAEGEESLTMLRETMQAMVDIWTDLKPVESVARTLFPQMNPLFNVLDKAMVLEQELLKSLPK